MNTKSKTRKIEQSEEKKRKNAERAAKARASRIRAEDERKDEFRRSLFLGAIERELRGMKTDDLGKVHSIALDGNLSTILLAASIKPPREAVVAANLAERAIAYARRFEPLRSRPEALGCLLIEMEKLKRSVLNASPIEPDLVAFGGVVIRALCDLPGTKQT